MTPIDAVAINAASAGTVPAIVWDERVLNWHDANDFILRFASVLADMNVSKGDRVGILADNSDLFLMAFFAVPSLGAILVPFNTRLAPVELADCIALSKPSVILFDTGSQSLASSALRLVSDAPRLIPLRNAEDALDTRIAKASAVEPVSAKGSDPVAIFFTGGTTGRSKGAVMTHSNREYVSLAMFAAQGLRPEGIRYLHAAPMFHVADAIFVHAVTLAGGTHFVLPRFDAKAVIDAIAQHDITDIILVPTMIAAVLDELDRTPRDLPSLQRMYYGAMPMPEATARRLLKALPSVAPVQLYGQSEAGPVLTLLQGEDHDISGKTERIKSAGKPLPGVHIAIMDDDGRFLPVGEVGEIVAKSPGIMPCYWDNPEQTEKTIREGWLHTGDGGRLDEDGFLYIADRIKDMIISGGENIYSVEVEQVLSMHAGVSQCAVIGLPDEKWGERVHAVLVAKDGGPIPAIELEAHCRTKLAGYKVPRSYEWVQSLPLSGPGKILKRVLRDEAIARLANQAEPVAIEDR